MPEFERRNDRREVALFSGVLERHYDAQGPSLHPLVRREEKRAYRVEREQGEPWVLHAYPVGGWSDSALGQAAVLSFLEERRYPASRLVGTRDSTPVVEHQGWRVIVTTFTEGTSTAYSPSSLRLLGAALGRLHALSPAAATRATPALPVAGMRPANEVRWALGRITAVEQRVPAALRERYDTLIAALHRIHDCEDLPKVVIHNDCHPGNTVQTPAGQVILIDWEGAGFGPAVVDVGFLLVSCDTESPWTPPLPPDPARVRTVVEGYCRHHALTTAELDRLPDAMRFRSLVFGASSFADAIEVGRREEEDGWWWRRYQAVDELAARARKHFATCL